MPSRLALLLAATIGLTALQPADAVRPRNQEQDEAFKGLQQRRILPLRQIESMIVPRMRGFDYLGPEFDAGLARYRLKFMRGPQVVWIDVDARTGQVVGHSGNR